MNIKKNKLTLALLLSALVLLSLTSSSLALPMTGLENELQQERQTVTVTTRAQGSTGEDVPLAGAEAWAQAAVEINNAPDNAVVTSVRVKYHVAYAEPSDLEVRLLTSGAEVSYTLWNRQHAEGGTLTQSTEEITAFQGVPVNGTWSLAVQGGGPEGYIDDFSIVVYYETAMPVLHVEGEGAPGTPIILRLPEGATPASLSPDTDDKPSDEGLLIAPLDVPPGATIIKTENFEGVFPNDLWNPHDNSSDGYERYWDDASCDACGGDWAMWPADGGANAISPCTPNNYPNNMYAWVEYGPFDLSDATDAGTEFTMWHDMEPYYDWVFFGVSSDGITYSGIFWDGYTPCTLYNITYSDWTGDSSVWVAWVFYSDYIVTDRGPWVDDIVIWKEGDPWDRCFRDTNYTTEYQFDLEGSIIRGQAVAPGSPYFPAPLTGYARGGYAYFTIAYRLEAGVRFYEIRTSNASGTTWGISNDTSDYYDPPHAAQLTRCSAAVSGLEGDSGANK